MKCEDVTKQGFCNLPLLRRKLHLRGSLFMLVLIQFQSGCLFEVGTNSRLGAYSNKYSSFVFARVVMFRDFLAESLVIRKL